MSVQAMADVWRFAPKTILTPGELLLLLEIADAVNDDSRMAWESVATMAKKIGQQERSIYREINRLTELGILELVPEEEWPPGAFQYKSAVRRLTTPDRWVTPDNLSVSTPGVGKLSTPAGVTLTPGSDNSVLITNTPTERNQETSSLAISPPARSRKDSSKRSSKQREDPDAQLDHQALVEAEFFGTSDEPPAPARKRTPPGPDTATGLARYFSERLVKTKADWSSGLSPVNYHKLGGELKRWLDNGVTPDKVRAMMDVYVDDARFRDQKRLPWVDFLGQRGILAFEVERLAMDNRGEDHRYDDDYWDN